MTRWLGGALFLLLLTAGTADAHVSDNPATSAGWSADLWVLLPMLVVILLYAAGVARLWWRAGARRGIAPWRACLFGLGMAALAAALLSPLDPAAEVWFSAHMAQHMLLVVVAPPLIALGSTGVALLSGLPGALRIPTGRILNYLAPRRLRAALFGIPGATAIHGLVVWLWHAPGLYEAALADDAIHYLEHATMFGSALLFWWSAINARHTAAVGYGAGIAALFVTMMHTGVLGILITLAPVPLYATYVHAGPHAGLGPLEDQQLAGIVMLAGGFAYLAGGLALLSAWLNAASHRQATRTRMGA